jgi:hypothetical protein
MQKAKRLRHLGEVALGLVLAATPLALWIAWSATLVLCVMLIALLCAALLALLVESAPEGEHRAHASVALPPEFIEEVHRLFPLTYHHSRHETQRFRQAMQKLAKLAGVSRS